MAQKISYWLIIALVLSIGFGQLLHFNVLNLPIYLHDLLVILILLTQITQIKIVKFKTMFDKYCGLKIFMLGVLIGAVRAISIYPITSLAIPMLYSLRILSYVFLFLIIKIQKIKIPLSIFLLSGVTLIIIGLLQYFALPDMRVFKYLGWDDHLNRLTLPHFDPTFTGASIALFVLSIIEFKFVGSTMIYALSILSILLTYARSIWLSLLAVGLLFIKDKKISVVIIVSLIITMFMLPKRFGEGTNLLRTYSISSRYNSDWEYVKKYKWDLVVGRGMNTLILDSNTGDFDNHATGPNNSYLYLLTTVGLLGCVGWLIFIRSIYGNSRHKIMILFFLVVSLFNNVMFYPFALLWVLIVEAMVPNEV